MNIAVENIKCQGCAGTITNRLTSAFETKSIKVDIEKGIVSIDIDETKREEVAELLLNLGYPENDTVHGLGSAKATAKSFISCAIGKINE